MPIASSKIVVIVASTGRPVELSQLIDQLSLQTRSPDQIIASVASDTDIPSDLPRAVRVVKGPKGSCCQRNLGLELALADSDIVVFFDDDYLPSINALAEIDNIFDKYPDVVGLNGALLADGAKAATISYEQALQIIKVYDGKNILDSAITPLPHGLYGCNMAYRSAAIGNARFDENLPLYGWQEDIDFSVSISRNHGRLVKTDAFAGVHRGTKAGRTSGKRLGYSQIINPVYLHRKGTMQARYAFRLILGNVVSNALKVIRPEPWIDRRGRLLGNMKGFVDLIRGRVDPTSVLQI